MRDARRRPITPTIGRPPQALRRLSDFRRQKPTIGHARIAAVGVWPYSLARRRLSHCRRPGPHVCPFVGASSLGARDGRHRTRTRHAGAPPGSGPPPDRPRRWRPASTGKRHAPDQPRPLAVQASTGRPAARPAPALASSLHREKARARPAPALASAFTGRGPRPDQPALASSPTWKRPAARPAPALASSLHRERHAPDEPRPLTVQPPAGARRPTGPGADV